MIKYNPFHVVGRKYRELRFTNEEVIGVHIDPTEVEIFRETRCQPSAGVAP